MLAASRFTVGSVLEEQAEDPAEDPDGAPADTDGDDERRPDHDDAFEAGLAMIVRGLDLITSGTDICPADLCGKVVASERGTVRVSLLLHTRASCACGMTVQQHRTNSDALLRLRTGRAAAVLEEGVDRLIADGSYTATIDRWHLQTGAVGRALLDSGRGGA